jgi:hypothetical protein
MATVTWIPDQPEDADKWQQAIDTVFASSGAGRVELLHLGTCWRVRFALLPPSGSFKPGETLPPETDMTQEIVAALKAAGLPVC